jgi:uncharacterized protein (DUF302 family)
MKRLIAAAFAALLLIPTVAAADNGVITKPSAYSADETLARLEQSLTKRGFMIFAKLDHAAAAKSKGLTMPYSTVLVFGNPKLGTPNFIIKPELAIDLPLKALVWADKDGKVFLSYNSGTYLHQTIYARHGAPFKAKATARINKGFGVITDEVVK